MSKRSIQKKPTAPPPPADTRIIQAGNVAETTTVRTEPGSRGSTNKRSRFVRWFLLVAFVGLCVGLALSSANMREAWLFPTRSNLVDRFVTLRNEKDKAAFDLLGPAPVFDEQPVSEKTAEVRQTDFFLRADLEFVKVLPGEPDGEGKQRPAAGRFTIVTKGTVSSPVLHVRNAKGIATPSQLNMLNPDLVVEVRHGKIYGLRSELHMGP